MHIPSLPLAAKLAAGAMGTLIVAAGAVTAVGLSLHHTNNVQASAPSAGASPAPPPSAAARLPNPGARAVQMAVVQAEAQILALTPAQLRTDLRSGTSVQTLAGQKGISQAEFQAQLTKDLKPLLDQAVQSNAITPAQEQKALGRLAKTIPNWDRTVRAPATPKPSA